VRFFMIYQFETHKVPGKFLFPAAPGIFS